MPYNREEGFRRLPFFIFCLERRIFMLENRFQGKLITEIKKRFPGAMVLKNDSNYKQGIPDLLILHNNNWAALEVKKSKTAPCRPNQEYYIDELEKMSFARIVYPENKEEVLDELQRSFQSRRPSRVSKRK